MYLYIYGIIYNILYNYNKYIYLFIYFNKETIKKLQKNLKNSQIRHEGNNFILTY